ncbi:MAG: response regulator [Chloroflexi bacterium]|nr:response regulator [Chloroflexota bacterium]MDL1886196.1 response regulator [Anaerolineae bacterium CFX8]
MAKKVLIVDDEAFIRQLIEQTLEELEAANIEILTASNGEAALQIIQETKPDLVFLDVMMPKLNGFEVCRIVKQEPALSGTYIIMLTAKGQEFDRHRGQQVGADVYMTKPFDPDELLNLAVKALAL